MRPIPMGVRRSVGATIPEPMAVLLGIEDRTKGEWRVDGETRMVWVAVKKD